MHITEFDPKRLRANPWNPNVVDPINQDKLETSLKKDGLQKAILVRTLENGDKEILDGQHRVEAAIALDWDSVACVDLGSIGDGEAKKQTLIGNSRYGDDDPLMMSNLLSDADIGSAAELLETLPFDESTLTSYFEHGGVDLDDLDKLDGIDDSDDLDLELPPGGSGITHQVLRFKVSADDAVRISDHISKTKHGQGFTESDDLTNAGDALVYLIGLLDE